MTHSALPPAGVPTPPTSTPSAEKAHMEMCGSATLAGGRVVPGCHIDTGPAAEYAEFLIVPMGDGQDAIEVIHEPCGTRVLTTMTVHLDTLVRIAPDHHCPPGLSPSGGDA